MHLSWTIPRLTVDHKILRVYPLWVLRDNYLTFVRHEAAESVVPSSTATAVDYGRQPPLEDKH
jgi:hypothetical protein